MSTESSFPRPRQKAQVSIDEVSAQLGYPLSTMYRRERGEIEPNPSLFSVVIE